MISFFFLLLCQEAGEEKKACKKGAGIDETFYCSVCGRLVEMVYFWALGLANWDAGRHQAWTFADADKNEITGLVGGENDSVRVLASVYIQLSAKTYAWCWYSQFRITLQYIWHFATFSLCCYVVGLSSWQGSGTGEDHLFTGRASHFPHRRNPESTKPICSTPVNNATIPPKANCVTVPFLSSQPLPRVFYLSKNFLSSGCLRPWIIGELVFPSLHWLLANRAAIE